MKDGSMIKRFMIVSLACEAVYAIAAAVIIFIRPNAWVEYVLSHITGYDNVPPNDKDIRFIATVLGFIAIFFVLWGLMKHMEKTDKDPLPIGILTLVYLPAFLLLHWEARKDMLERLAHEVPEVAQFAFYSLHFSLFSTMTNISLISVVFLLMAYAALRQRYLDRK